jgi:quercetin 2,3-dioxygenase
MSDPIPGARTTPAAEVRAPASAPVLERIATRVAEVGDGLMIRRALPSHERRLVGAWCFLDHAGPLTFGPGGGLGVGPHPHIGLQTFTWMIEGALVHRDSLGNEQRITPGQVNLMTAGRGISHAEDSESATAGRLHAVQLWIALPDSQRQCAPAFRNYPQLPRLERGGFTVRVLAGKALGATSPVEVFSPLLGLDCSAAGAAQLQLPVDPQFEHAALVLEGSASIEGEALAPGTFLYLGRARESLSLRCAAATRLILVGGAPFNEEVLLWWNFVARDAGEMEQATRDWNEGRRFGVVRGSPSRPLVAPDVRGLRLRAGQRPPDADGAAT